MIKHPKDIEGFKICAKCHTIKKKNVNKIYSKIKRIYRKSKANLIE